MDQNQENLPETGLVDGLNEALSALMDGEADELELRRILRELPARPELAAAWTRYHTVRASLQQDILGNPSVNLLAGVQARLAAEQTDPQSAQEFGRQRKFGAVLRSRVVRYVGQGAIAASVAVAALMGVSVLETADTGSSAPAVEQVAGAGNTPALNGEFNAEKLSRTTALDPEAYDRLEQAVYREFSDLPAPAQIPVSYNPEFPVRTTPAE